MNITYNETKEFSPEELQNIFSSVGWLSANYPERLVKAMKNSSTVISAWANDKLIGLANALDDGELTAYVHYLLVNPAYQKMGIGKELVTRMKEKYQSYLYITLISEDKSMVAFYEKCGFKIVEGAKPLAIAQYQR